ncbi:MAG: MMPL family transporter [Sphaerochaetaceae bacterium]|nr:MMPL family transporter [Sphaerochaetaceae bacterium]MDD3366231.1 MMPL family transporter [Sphaerochaetaceae bacterium]MDD4219762.1 MMPL family transporter [Sphaerochaetaceae bacterium]
MKKTTSKDLAIILGAILLAVASLSLLGRLHIDSSTDAFIPQKAEVVSINNEIERQFGSMDAMLVGISTQSGSVLTAQSLEIIEAMTVQFSTIEGVDSVVSLTNSDHMQSSSDGFEAVSLYNKNEADPIANLSKRLAEWPEVYDGTIISTDRTMAAIIIQPKTNLSQEAQDTILKELKAIVDATPRNSLQFSYVGLPVVKQQINESLMQDMAILAPIVGLLIILVLFFSFRRFGGVLLPLIGLVISASITVGIMAILNITFTMATMLVPVLLLIVGSAYAIHVMSHFYAEVALFNRTLDPGETQVIIHEVVHRNRLPIIMAGATTAAGFIAQFTSPLGPFRTFGLLSAIGVILSQLSALYLLPALLRVTYRNGIDPNKLRTSREQKRARKGGHPAFALLTRISLKGRIPLIVISVIFIIATVALVPTIKTGTNMLDFFKPSSALVKDTNRFNSTMNGSGILTVMIDGKDPSAVLTPQFLAALDEFSATMEKLPAVGKVQTVTPYIKRMNLIMNKDTEPYSKATQTEASFDFFGGSFGLDADFDVEEDVIETNSAVTWDPQTYHEIPTDPAKYGLETDQDLQNMISQYLLLYSGNLNNFINDSLEPNATLITIQLQQSDTQILRDTTAAINTYWTDYLDNGWEYAIGGGEAIALALSDLVTKSQIYSLVGALLIVWVLVSIIFRSPAAGFLGLIPVVFALMGIFSFMALLKIHLDIITSLLAALAIGIGVDYAIHFLAAFQRQDTSKDQKQVLARVMNTTGRAIVINAASVIIGFSGLIFSRFMPIKQMGILFCVSMLFAGISSLTVLPMVIHMWQPKFIYNHNANKSEQKSITSNKRRITP